MGSGRCLSAVDDAWSLTIALPSPSAEPGPPSGRTPSSAKPLSARCNVSAETADIDSI